MKKILFISLVFAFSVFSNVCANTDNGNIYLFSKGQIAFEDSTSKVDSVALESGETILSLYAKDKSVLYSATIADIDSITFGYDNPVADLLDVIFNLDGTATDVSAMHNTIELVNTGNTANTIYSNEFKRYIGRFTNTYSGTATGFYKVDYTSNTAFQNALADGHTLEMLFLANYTGTIPDNEAKIFSSHQSGGTGFLISKVSGTRKNEITFLPNVSSTGTTSNWIWATSGIVPVAQTYYHVVGVWNKEASKAYIYVNGELKNTVDAAGLFKLPATGCTWFALGGDPSSDTNANTCLPGDLVVARIYDKPLSQLEVSALWYGFKKQEESVKPDLVSGVSYANGLDVKKNISYIISGTGFAKGDTIQFIMTSNTSKIFAMPVIVDSATAIHIVIPDDFVTGQYRMILKRGDDKQDLGLNVLNLVTTETAPRATQVIAHRGYWNIAGAAQNSRTSLKNALALNVYGSETDIWLTSDDSIVVNHDATLNGVTLQTSAYNAVKDLTLSNGETLPRLREFLETLKESSSPTKLIIEIKSHSTAARNIEAGKKVVALVKEMGITNKVEYISFSLNACHSIVEADSTAKVSYLTCSLDPATLLSYGITGLDYTAANFSSHPTWIADAHNLGMTTNIWTIDNRTDIIAANNADHDFVTTNNPVKAKTIYEYYKALKNIP